MDACLSFGARFEPHGSCDESLLVQVVRASLCVEDDDLDGARAALKEALDRPPHDAAETNLLGLLHFGLGDTAKAREVYLRGLARWGDWAALLFNVAVCDLKLGRHLEARAYLERLVATRPRHRRAWACLALVHARLGERGLARAAFERARDPDEQRPTAPSSAASEPDFSAVDSHPLEEEDLAGEDEDPVFVIPAEPPEAAEAARASLPDGNLAFVPRSIPVTAESGPRRSASRVFTAVLAAAAGFVLTAGIARRMASRPALPAPPQTASPAAALRRRTGGLREAPAPVFGDAPGEAAGLPTDGVLRTPQSARGHRVFVDGRLRTMGGEAIRLRCGPHEVQIGSAGRKQRVVVPCGGEIDVAR